MARPFFGNATMNETTHPSESMGLERSSSSNGAPYMLSPPVPFFFVKSAGGKGNTSQWRSSVAIHFVLALGDATVRLLAINQQGF